MSDRSAIQWTEATWNPVRGCTKVSPGCAHCYAETFAERFRGVPGHPYEQGFDLRLVPDKLTEPLTWKKPRRVFVSSMSDLFQDGVPDAYIGSVFKTMGECPQHTFQVLTKRPARMLDYVQRQQESWRSIGVGGPLSNVWLGVSCENQHFADERIPLLLQTPAAIRFISAEPLLGPVNVKRYMPKPMFYCPRCGREKMRDSCHCGTFDNRPTNQIIGLDWVIVGGESGSGARPFDVAWARSIVQQCQAASVPCFVKQLGARAYVPDVHSAILRDRKGGDPSEWPADLRIREFPTVQG